MTAPTTVEEAIEQVALGMVSKISENGREIEKTPLKDLIAADQYLATTTAATKAHFGMRMTKCVPPGGG